MKEDRTLPTLAGWRDLPGFVIGPGDHAWQLKSIRITREFVCSLCGCLQIEIRTENEDGKVCSVTDAPECPGCLEESEDDERHDHE